MFRKKSEAPEPTSTRYKVEVFHSMGKHEALAEGVERALNLGEDNGWRLAFITQHAGTFFIYWDTEPTQ